MSRSAGEVDFNSAKFSGGSVGFTYAGFSGGEVDFSDAIDWSSHPHSHGQTPRHQA
jgi:hypothetical protein